MSKPSMWADGMWGPDMWGLGMWGGWPPTKLASRVLVAPKEAAVQRSRRELAVLVAPKEAVVQTEEEL